MVALISLVHLVVLSAFPQQTSAALAPLHIKQVNAGQMYGVNVTVGTPVDGTSPQVFSLLVSISQQYTWIPGADCMNCNFLACKAYNHSNSTTYVAGNATFTDAMIELIDNDAPNGQSPHGFLSQDVLSLSSDILIPNSFKFGELTEGRFIDFTQGYDGVLGLGMTAQSGLQPSELSQYNVVLAMKEAKLIDSAIVGLWLDGTLGNNSQVGHGEITFGAINEELMDKEQLSYFPLLPHAAQQTESRYPSWRVTLQSMKINGELFEPNVSAQKNLSTGGHSYRETSAISAVSFNTATYWSEVPQADLDAIAVIIGATYLGGSYLMPTGKPFNITWFFAGEGGQTTSVTLTDKDLVSPSVFGPQLGVLLMVGSAASELPSDIGWVFGTTFMHTMYTVLDYEQQRIGLAPKKDRTNRDSVMGQTQSESQRKTVSSPLHKIRNAPIVTEPRVLIV